MSARDFLQDIVRPNVSDFHANFGSRRHAYNAVSAVDALAAHLYVWATPTPLVQERDPLNYYYY